MAVLTCPPGSQQRQKHKAFVCHFILNTGQGRLVSHWLIKPHRCERTLQICLLTQISLPRQLRQRASSS